MDELPTDTVVTVDRARMSSGNAVSDGADTAELLDVDVDELTWSLALIAGSAGSKVLRAKDSRVALLLKSTTRTSGWT
jgi:hypothetical protein